MSRRSSSAAAHRIEATAPTPREAPATAWEGPEDEFFRRGDLGRFEPPVYLPLDSLVFPFVGIAFLALLTVLALH